MRYTYTFFVLQFIKEMLKKATLSQNNQLTFLMQKSIPPVNGINKNLHKNVTFILGDLKIMNANFMP